jgi:maltose alpha-D-glucosyltransferase/alpha-amylase
VERDGTNNENLPETHAILKAIRSALDAGFKDRMLLAEANQWPEDTQAYFGDGDECHMAFHFPLMPRMYMAIAQEDRFPITDIMRQTPEIPETCQWAIFLRNHDELTLEMVTDEERDYLWNTYAGDRRARINLGIRRRLAPLMERDRRRIELMNCLLLTMPGTPTIYYGDEIGMGDNIHLGDRDGVRTPMQWSQDRNGGFSRSDPAELVLPVIQDPLYGFMSVNVESQLRDPHSLLNWLRRMLAVRRSQKAFGRGRQRFLRPRNRKILAYLREHDGAAILCVANLARTAQAVELDLSEFQGRTPVELSGNTPFPPIGQLTYLLTLPPFGFYWFDLRDGAAGPGWSTSSVADEREQTTFVVRGGMIDLMSPQNRQVLEGEVLAHYLPARRWFQGKDAVFIAASVKDFALLPGADVVLSTIEVRTSAGLALYTLAFGAAWDGDVSGPYAPALAMARVRRGRRLGRLTDGFATPGFVRSVVGALSRGETLTFGAGTLHFDADPGFDPGDDPEIEWMSAEQSNSSVIVGRRMVLKLLRRVVAGVHPEAEMSRALSSRGFAATPAFLGEVVRRGADGETHTLMVVQAFVHNQGDGWDFTLNYLTRALDQSIGEGDDEALTGYLAFARTLGRRLAEMHAALAQPSVDPAFQPQIATDDDVAGWRDEAARELDAALDRLEGRAFEDEAVLTLARDLLQRRDSLRAAIAVLAHAGLGSLKTRVHGDLHLGQVLVAKADVVIIDFEGEPTKSLEQRRAKGSPLRDVAGVLRSFDYAAGKTSRDHAPETAEAQGRLDRLLARFRTEVPEAFLAGYAEGGGQAEGPLLTLFLLEKAAYEVAYEAANRPPWIGVPLEGLHALVLRLGIDPIGDAR